MNKVFLHSKNDEEKNIKTFYYLLLLFIVGGILKNGLILYQNKLITLIELFKPFYLCVISLGVSFLFSLFCKEKFFSNRLLCNILIGLIVMPNIGYIIYTVVLLILNIMYSFKKFHIASFYMIIVSIIYMLLNNYTYLNSYESSKSLQYGILDYLFGKGYGGISNTFLLLTIILFIILICNKVYKKYISISFIISYFILSIISAFILNDFSLSHFINNNILFAVIFIAPISLFSPYTRGGCYLYGIALSLICFGFSFWDINLGIYIGISLLSICSKILDKPFVK